MVPLLGPTKLSGAASNTATTACMIASPTENTANLFGLAPSYSQARLNGGQTKRGVTVSEAKLTDGSSHSCPELRVRRGAWVSKAKREATLMASAFSLVDDAGIQFKGRAAEVHQLARERARRLARLPANSLWPQSITLWGMMRVLHTGQTMSIAPLQMGWYWWTGLKGCSCKWTQRITIHCLVLKREAESPTSLQGEQTLPAVHMPFAPLFQQVSILTHIVKRPSAAYHLTAHGNLDWSDLKVHPDWSCPHSGEWWISLWCCIPICRPDRATDGDLEGALALTQQQTIGDLSSGQWGETLTPLASVWPSVF